RDAERQSRHANAERLARESVRHLSFLTLQRWNAFRDAPRHPSAPYRTCKSQCRTNKGITPTLKP
ncbi:DUF1534 domain-containing protein, partial [Pseudomonas syringae]|nr:DUF1534 domain-containing protein [Pseudomonas syringae]